MLTSDGGSDREESKVCDVYIILHSSHCVCLHVSTNYSRISLYTLYFIVIVTVSVHCIVIFTVI